jgi:hypothetical protein
VPLTVSGDCLLEGFLARLFIINNERSDWGVNPVGVQVLIWPPTSVSDPESTQTC